MGLLHFSIVMAIIVVIVRVGYSHTINYNLVVVCDAWLQHEFLKFNNLTHSIPSSGVSINVEIIPASPEIKVTLEEMKNVQFYHGRTVIIAIGESYIIKLADIVAKGAGVPLLTFDTSFHGNEPLGTEYHTSVDQTNFFKGISVARLLGRKMLSKSHIIFSDDMLGDGFYDGLLKQYSSEGPIKGIPGQTVIKDLNGEALQLKIAGLLSSKYNIFIIHASSSMSRKIVESVNHNSLFIRNTVWILAGDDYLLDDNGHIPIEYPVGLLALRINKNADMLELLSDTLNKSIKALTNMTEYEYDRLWREDFIERVHKTITGNRETDYSLCDSFYVIQLLNMIRTVDGLYWSYVGNVTCQSLYVHHTVVLPGRSIIQPLRDMQHKYRVATKKAEPFIFIHPEPVSNAADCYSDVPCLRINTTNAMRITAILEQFDEHNEDIKYTSANDFSVHCCKGLTIDILRKLSDDLNIEFILYFNDDNNYGVYNSKNHSWTGLLNEVITGPADLIAGAFSMTSDRMKVVSYSEPFYYTSYSMVGLPASTFAIPTDAFMRPFAAEVWTLVFVIGVVVAIGTSLLEWNSPFGLNPWGRRREKKYTLASALCMVYSLLFGHLVNFKSPKSWPARVLQNFWAGLSIFIIASYTANLTAYMAGSQSQTEVKSIHDREILKKRMSIIKTTALEAFVTLLNPALADVLPKYYATSTRDGLTKVKNGETDLFIGDRAILDYHLRTLDSDCQLTYMGNSFGGEPYAFGLRKVSFLQESISKRIMEYKETGYIDKISKKYFRPNNCNEHTIVPKEYSLEQTYGLFLMLILGMVSCCLLLALEHVVYKWYVPYVRRKPETSFFKSRCIEYLSQRLYKIINSHALVPPKKYAKDFIQILKKKEFAKLFQKEEIHKAKHPRGVRAKQDPETPEEIAGRMLKSCLKNGYVANGIQNGFAPRHRASRRFNYLYSNGSSVPSIYSSSHTEVTEEDVHLSEPNLTVVYKNHTVEVPVFTYVNPSFHLGEDPKTFVTIENETMHTQDDNVFHHIDRSSPPMEIAAISSGHLSDDISNAMKAIAAPEYTLSPHKRCVSDTCLLNSPEKTKTLRSKSHFRLRSDSISGDNIEEWSKEDLIHFWKKSEIEMKGEISKTVEVNNLLRKRICILLDQNPADV